MYLAGRHGAGGVVSAFCTQPTRRSAEHAARHAEDDCAAGGRGVANHRRVLGGAEVLGRVDSVHLVLVCERCLDAAAAARTRKRNASHGRGRSFRNAVLVPRELHGAGGGSV